MLQSIQKDFADLLERVIADDAVRATGRELHHQQGDKTYVHYHNAHTTYPTLHDEQVQAQLHVNIIGPFVANADPLEHQSRLASQPFDFLPETVYRSLAYMLNSPRRPILGIAVGEVVHSGGTYANTLDSQVAVAGIGGTKIYTTDPMQRRWALLTDSCTPGTEISRQAPPEAYASAFSRLIIQSLATAVDAADQLPNNFTYDLARQARQRAPHCI